MHSGVALIAVDAQGENQILALPGANGLAARPTPCGAAVWFCPGEIPRTAQEGTRRRGARRRRDRGRQPVAAERLRSRSRSPRFDIAIVNETELDAFAGHLPARVVLTRGARGAVLLPEGTELPAMPAQRGRHDRRGGCVRGRPVRRPRGRRAARGGGAARARDRRDLGRATRLPAGLRDPRRGRRARRGRGHRRPRCPRRTEIRRGRRRSAPPAPPAYAISRLAPR